MQNKKIISSLIEISKELETLGRYKQSDAVDNITIKLAMIMSNEGAKASIEPFPGKHDVIREIGLPPQNLNEKLNFKLQSLLRKLRGKDDEKNNSSVQKFIKDILESYKRTSFVNSAFVDFMTRSPKFIEHLLHYLYIHPHEKNDWKKLFHDIRFTLPRQIEIQVEKFNKTTIESRKHKVPILEVVNLLAELDDVLPREVLSEIKATQELLEHRNTTEQHLEDYRKIRFEDPESQQNARQELDDATLPILDRIKKTEDDKEKNIIASLNKIANLLDNKKFYKEANIVTNVMKRYSSFMILKFFEDAGDFNGLCQALYNYYDKKDLDDILDNHSLRIEEPNNPYSFVPSEIRWNLAFQDLENITTIKSLNDTINIRSQFPDGLPTALNGQTFTFSELKDEIITKAKQIEHISEKAHETKKQTQELIRHLDNSDIERSKRLINESNEAVPEE